MTAVNVGAAVRTCAKVRIAWSSTTVRQAVGFACSNAALGGLGMITSALLARALDVDAYSSYTFGKQLLLFSAMFFEFGLFLPAARMLALSDPAERRRTAGAVVALFVPVSVLFGVTVFALSWIVDACLDVHAGPALRMVALVSVGYPLDFVCLQTAQGLDRLHSYSIASVLSRLGFLGLLMTLPTTGVRLTSSGVLLADTLFLLVGWVALLANLRPVFRGLRETMSRMLRGARDYGFSAYVGRVLSMGTYHMDTLMLGAASDPRSFACYMCAAALASPIALPSAGVATALFGRLTRQPRMEPRWVATVTLMSLLPAVALSTLAEPVVRLVYSEKFEMAAGLVPVLAAAQVISAVTRLFNSFLAAHGLGSDLRTAAITLTVSNLVLNLLLIPAFGAAGAAWASLLALAVNLIAHILRYRRAVDAGETALPDGGGSPGTSSTVPPPRGQGATAW
ncbi:lipopolysaccharide biosynthesis protein [Streptomyces sp. TP-A0356]|uniref:lipopolysaccharide biosynthesis protein n=1 Tax=Streptomyces sp. TP-A0356 TaxID=1359208 RepID=UPI0006E44D69|nr:lipopolysaccharide biosynthesis protein [Streptomyces sp. TP-A0356]